jgi:hypothetical protein
MKVVCKLFGHVYEVTRIVTPDITEFKCKVCGFEIARCHSLKATVILTREIKSLHTTLIMLHDVKEAQEEEFRETLKKSLCQN